MFRHTTETGGQNLWSLVWSGLWSYDVSALSEARPHKGAEKGKNRGRRAFDKAVRRKPLAGAADAGRYGNSIDFALKSLARRGLWSKGSY
jgi:hypothetical protein